MTTDTIVDAPRHDPPRTAGTWVVGALMFAGVGALAWGARSRLQQRDAVAHSAPMGAGARPVSVARPRSTGVSAALPLAGTVQPAQRAVILARSTGYVRRVRVELGDRVRAGQVLADVETPELAEQLRSARSRLREAELNVPLVESARERTRRMAAIGVVASQEEETAELRQIAARGTVAATRTEVQRLMTLDAYRTVVAPFAGTVVRRSIDPGALVAPGVTPLFELATTDALEVAVEVPQWLAGQAHVGQTWTVTARGLATPARGTVRRTAGALDPVARTLRVELTLAPGSGLLAGSYVEVQVPTPGPGARGLVVAATSLSMGNEGPRVAVVDGEQRARWRRVEILQDRGRDVELSGLRADDRVVVFPAAELVDGERVTATERVAPAGAGRR